MEALGGSTTKDAAAALAAPAIGCAYLIVQWKKKAAAAADDVLSNGMPPMQHDISFSCLRVQMMKQARRGGTLRDEPRAKLLS